MVGQIVSGLSGYAPPAAGAAVRGVEAAQAASTARAAAAAARVEAAKAAGAVADSGVAARAIGIEKELRAANGKQEPKISAQEQRAASLNKWSGRFKLPLMFDGIGMMAGMALGGLFGWLKLSRAATVVKAVALAPITALRASGTSVKGVLSLPANYFKAVSDIARENEVAHWADSTASKAKSMAEKAAEREAAFAKSTQGMRNSGRGGLDAFAKTTVGGGVEKGLGKASAWRLKRVNTVHGKTMAKAIAASTSQPVGFFGKIGNFIKGKKAAVGLAVPSEMQSIMSQIHGASAMSGEARVSQLTSAHGALQELMTTKGISAEVLGRAQAVAGHVEKAVSSSAALHGLENAAHGSLSNVAKAAAQTVGRVPLFGAIVGVGVALGIGAKVVEHKLAKAHSKTAYDDLAEMVGEAHLDSPFMEGVRKAYGSEGRNGVAKTAFGLASEVADAAWGFVPNGGGGAMMAAQMAPMIGDMFIRDNPLLNATVTLKKAESGEVQLDASQKLDCLKQLIAVVPSVAAHGGVYNQLAAAIAQEMIARNMDTKAVVQLLADESKFTAFSKEVSAKRADAAKGTAANDDEVATALPRATNDHEATTTHAAPVASHPASHAAISAQAHAHTATHAHHPQDAMARAPHETPSLKIHNSHSDHTVAQHEGMVAAGPKLAVGQN